LYYNLAPTRCSPAGADGEEFWSVAATEGIADIEELNKILDRAVNSRTSSRATSE